MKNISDWNKSVISLMGDPSKKRSTVTKAILVGLLGIMTAKAVITPLSSYIDPDIQASGGIPHTQIKEHLDDIGKKLNAEYGSEHTVIVLNNDSSLKFILANAESKMVKEDWGHETVTGQYRNKGASFLEEKMGIQVDQEMVRRSNLYDSVTSNKSGPTTTILGQHGYSNQDGLVIVNGWGGPDMTEFRSKFPFHFDLDSQNTFSFFHELAHAVDVRDGRPEEERPVEDVVLHSEAVADLGSALLFYRKTGNMDEWNYNIRPTRMALSQDFYHSTYKVVDRAMDTVDLDKVEKMSDREIMIYAKENVNIAVKDLLQKDNAHSKSAPYSDWDEMRRVEAIYGGEKDFHKGFIASSMRWLDRINDGKGEDVIRDHSRSVMEASLNNLAYNGKFEQYEDVFKQKVLQHITDYKDQKAANAYSLASAGSHFDEKSFATEMGFKIDYDSNLRKDYNDDVLHSYFEEKSGQDALVGFHMNSVEQNIKQSVIGRYVDKAANYIFENNEIKL